LQDALSPSTERVLVSDYVRQLAAAFQAAVPLGAKGSVCFSEITGHPYVLTLAGPKTTFKLDRNAPEGERGEEGHQEEGHQEEAMIRPR